MKELFIFLSHYNGYVSGLLIVIIFILGGLLIRNTLMLSSFRQKFGLLMESKSGEDLEQMLKEHLEERKKLLSDHSLLLERTATLERKMQKSKRHLGLVRYDAFNDVGGEQSFALAVYDDNGDGAMLTTVVGRADCRVYGKPLSQGKGERPLTPEEDQAIINAVSLTSKA
jgi:hypothetical protein